MNYVVGIDPSLTGTGLIVMYENGKFEASRHTSAPTDGKAASRMERYKDLTSKIIRALPPSPPCLIAIEGYSFGSKGRACDIAEFGGILRYRLRYDAFEKFSPRILEVPPSTLKKYTTGRGDADKKAIEEALTRRYNFVPRSSDEADAYALARMAMAYCELAKPEQVYQKEIIERLLFEVAAR